MEIATFLLHTASLNQVIRLTGYAIHIRLHPKNINRDSGIEIPEAWMPTIKKHNNRRTVRQRTAARTTEHRNSEDRNAPITAVENQPITAQQRAL